MNTQPEIFTVIFNSVGSNVLSIGIEFVTQTTGSEPPIYNYYNNYNRVTYDVNWMSFLPTKYKKFECQFVFKSKYVIEGLLGPVNILVYKDNGIVDMNIGRTNTYNGLQMSNVIGLIKAVSEASSKLSYSSTATDNNSFLIDYPSNNQITISLNRFNNTLLQYMSEYCLILTLTGILDGDIDKSN